MHITRQDLATIAHNLLKHLEDHPTLKDLEHHLKKKRRIKQTHDTMTFKQTKPHHYTLSYQRKTTKNPPLEIRINHELNYTNIMLTCAEKLEQYTAFAKDLSDNIFQNKIIHSSDLTITKQELERLAHYQN